MSLHLLTLKRAFTVALALPAAAAAQVPGAPVLQNAFNNPGLSVAVNFGGGGGGGSGQSYYGAAAAWGLGSGRIALSGAAGAQRANGATRGAYGGRLALSAWTSSGGSLGVGGFVGLGGAPSTRTGSTVTNPAVMTIPAGLSLGYRRALGQTRGLSGYVSPFYRWMRTNGAGTVSSGAMRVSAGIDFSLSPALGATVGGELGSGGGGGGSSGQRASGTFGAAISFVPGRR